MQYVPESNKSLLIKPSKFISTQCVASMEAARAGEAGKGFAVVADEIRKLAEETSNSTDQIGSIIASIQEDSNQTVKKIRDVRKNNELQNHGSLSYCVGNAKIY